MPAGEEGTDVTLVIGAAVRRPCTRPSMGFVQWYGSDSYEAL